MKIALIANEYESQFPLGGYGGIEIYVETLAKGLHRNGLDFFVVCPKRESREDYPFEIIEANEPPAKITKRSPHYFASEVRKILSDRKPDVIWSQSNWSADALHDLGIPIICAFHDSCAKQFGWIRNYSNVKYKFLTDFHYSNWIKEEWERKKSFVCHCGLGEEEFSKGVHKNNYLWCAGLKWGPQAKGLDIFLKLAEVNKDKEFKVYGGGSEEMERYILDFCKLNSNVFFGGELPRGAKHEEAFASAKFFVIPSQIPETAPRTIIEALSKGTPVIGSLSGSVPEMVGEFGVCSNEFEKLNEALNISIDRDKAFEYSKKFHINEEIKVLISQSASF